MRQQSHGGTPADLCPRPGHVMASHSLAWIMRAAHELLPRAPCALLRARSFAPSVSPDMLTLSGPAAPGQAHRNTAVKPGIKPLPERHPVSPSLALTTRLHFCCFTPYKRFLLFLVFSVGHSPLSSDFGHGKQTRLLFASFRCM